MTGSAKAVSESERPPRCQTGRRHGHVLPHALHDELSHDPRSRPSWDRRPDSRSAGDHAPYPERGVVPGPFPGTMEGQTSPHELHWLPAYGRVPGFYRQCTGHGRRYVPVLSFPDALLGPRPAYRHDSLALCPGVIPSRAARSLCLEQGGAACRLRPVIFLPYPSRSRSFLLRSERPLERYAVSGRSDVLRRGSAGISDAASRSRVIFLPAGEAFSYLCRQGRAALRVWQYTVPTAANHVFGRPFRLRRGEYREIHGTWQKRHL